jgi:hypothetical protein
MILSGKRHVHGIPKVLSKDCRNFVILNVAKYTERDRYTKHKHPAAFEFSFIEKGKAFWEVSGELFETRAGEMHSAGYNILEPCRSGLLSLALTLL